MIPLRVRQLLAVLILLAALAVVMGLVIGPWFAEFQSGHERIEQLRQRLEQRIAQAVRRGGFGARLAELKRDDPLGRLVLAESRPSLAGAELQQQIGRLVGETGAQLVSIQIVSTTESDAPLPSVGLKVHMRGETDQMVRLLYALAYHKPLLLLDNLVVLSNPRVDMQRIRQAEDLKAAPSLDVSFDLKGYIAKEAAP